MKINLFLFAVVVAIATSCNSSKVEWISTTENEAWHTNPNVQFEDQSTPPDVLISLADTLQTIDGFGACFNEMGWTSLSLLSQTHRDSILKELFAPNVGANFSICRMPLGANDFSRDWYSYNETEGDFEMTKFSIENDTQTLIPFIKSAQKFNPDIKLWASPWSPPSWMKWNKHYACAVPWDGLPEKFHNQLPADRQGKEGTNMFIQDTAYFEAYALYFSKFIEEYKKQNINISMVMPQNEFNSCQIFPSCTWTASGLSEFIGKYLAPQMVKQNVEIMFGTMERPTEALVDTILTAKGADKYIKGVGFQWAGKDAIQGISKRYPNLKLYQTEQECGDGKNDWKYCEYAWSLMQHYIKSGANAYLYWNISLEEGGFSRWGWQQNSLVTVNAQTKTFRFNHEYYLLKHVSHFVQSGAKLLKTSGDFTNILAFQNPDNQIVIVVYNDSDTEKKLSIKIGDKTLSPTLKAKSFNTLRF